MVLIEEGRIALDVVVDVQRPQRRGNARLSGLEAEVLGPILYPAGQPPVVRYAQGV